MLMMIEKWWKTGEDLLWRFQLYPIVKISTKSCCVGNSQPETVIAFLWKQRKQRNVRYKKKTYKERDWQFEITSMSTLVCISVPICVCLSVPISKSTYVSVSVFMCPSVCLSVLVCVSLSISWCPSVCVQKYVNFSLNSDLSLRSESTGTV